MSLDGYSGLKRALRFQIATDITFQEALMFKMLIGHAVGVGFVMSTDQSGENCELSVEQRLLLNQKRTSLLRARLLKERRDMRT